MANWDQTNTGDRVELGLVQVDIVGHSKLEGTDRALKEAKSIFRDQMEGMARSRGGRLFNWGGDGGSFMFLTNTGQIFDDLAFSAMQMLGNLSAINEEIMTRTDLDSPVAIRISCDSGIATFDRDPGRITADFINHFLKNERTLGLPNTVSVTERVWKQLTGRLREKYDKFKYSHEVESQIYNYGGKNRQREVLRSLCNVDQKGPTERPAEEAVCVEILAFAGDTLIELSKDAYADVVITPGFENVGGLNLLISKNAEICQRHIEIPPTEDSDSHPELSGVERSLLDEVLARERPEIRRDLLRYLGQASNCERERILNEIRESGACALPNILGDLRQQLREQPQASPHRWLDPFKPFNGGESLRFYNCTALGYVPMIGEGTLLDHVFAESLRITRVIGGVAEPAVKERVFDLVGGVFSERKIEPSHGESSGQEQTNI